MEAVTRAAALTAQSRGWRVVSLCLITLVSMATSYLPAQGKLHEDDDCGSFALKQGLEAKAARMLKEHSTRNAFNMLNLKDLGCG